jgi:hypothetical protein
VDEEVDEEDVEDDTEDAPASKSKVRIPHVPTS